MHNAWSSADLLTRIFMRVGEQRTIFDKSYLMKKSTAKLLKATIPAVVCS